MHSATRCSYLSSAVESRAGRLLMRILRHSPGEFGVTVDADGWAEIMDVLHAVNARAKELGLWREWTLRDLSHLTADDAGRRLEIAGGCIRARYGHSLTHVRTGPVRRPPERLYHGTSEDRLWSISMFGLRPGKRRFVQLTSDPDYAHEVAAGRGLTPVVLVILAAQAAQNGLEFIRTTETIWCVERLPPGFIAEIPRVQPSR